ncbi:MAG: hypothetical protein JRN20_17645 [Nitrososphaerota archaeon]|nr:hypothetical protein [Nitrososphaerota archaeon]MDG6923580.1 hypothetical protein [Nitrososphaerota archaeon]
MSPKSLVVEFSSVTVSFFVHATEDAERLISAVSSRLGLEAGDLQQETVEGYHGNQIISAKAHVIGQRALVLGNRLLQDLSTKSKKRLISELEKSMDEHDALYLRLDRQTINNELAFSDEEPIRVKLKPKLRVGGRTAVKKGYLELIE